MPTVGTDLRQQNAGAGSIDHAHPILVLQDATKAFPGVRALDKVSFDLRRGKVHAVCGARSAAQIRGGIAWLEEEIPSTSGTVCAAAARSRKVRRARPGKVSVMRIDAHQHFWRLRDRAGAWPPPALAAIYRDALPEDRGGQLGTAGVEGTVLVQSLPSLADTQFTLNLAGRNDFILGVVGWADLKAQDALAVIAEFASSPKLKGLRPMQQDMEADDWIDDPALAPAIEAMTRAGLVFDALVLPRHLPFLQAFATRHPDLPIVIDHGAKPPIAEGHDADWRRSMARLAGLDHVSCKLSGLLTEACAQKPEAVRPYAETILELSGPQRVIWGSDWPVLTLADDYQGWLSQCRAIVPEADHAAVFGGNARRFYSLGSTP